MPHTVETQTQTQRRAANLSASAETQPQAMSAAAGTNPGHKVLAERYKTKLCKTFMEHKVCPYETRCMFAHGEEELRTAEMNVRDGIVTEDAIRHFKRMQAYKLQAQQAAAAAEQMEAEGVRRPPSYTEASSHTVKNHHNATSSPALPHPSTQNYYDEYASEFDVSDHTPFGQNHHQGYNHYAAMSYTQEQHVVETSPLSRNNSSSASSCHQYNTEGDQYSYNPYAWTPFQNATDIQYTSEDALYYASLAQQQQQQFVAQEVEEEEEEVSEHTSEEEEEYTNDHESYNHYNHSGANASVCYSSSNYRQEILAPVKKIAASSGPVVEATSQDQVAGHALRRPMMP